MSHALLDWSGDVPAVAVVALLAVGYASAVRVVRRRGLSWPVGRSLAWAAGLVGILSVTATGVASDAHLLLWVYSVQLLVLLLGAPVLLACGRPVTLAGDALPEAVARRVLAPMRGPLRLLATPVAGPLVVPVVLFGVYFTPLLAATFRPGVGAQVLHLGLLVLGLLIAFGLVGEGGPAETSLALGAAVAICLGELLLDAVPGIVLAFSTSRLVPPPWGGLATFSGLTPVEDQQRAGNWLWLVAEFVDLPFLLVLVRRWVKADELEARRVDAELDRREVPAPPADRPASAGDPPAPELLRPWWEVDRERLAGHRLARELDRQEHGEPEPGAG